MKNKKRRVNSIYKSKHKNNNNNNIISNKKKESKMVFKKVK
jgi:hypothetical protein